MTVKKVTKILSWIVKFSILTRYNVLQYIYVLYTKMSVNSQVITKQIRKTNLTSDPAIVTSMTFDLSEDFYYRCLY